MLTLQQAALPTIPQYRPLVLGQASSLQDHQAMILSLNFLPEFEGHLLSKPHHAQLQLGPSGSDRGHLMGPALLPHKPK